MATFSDTTEESPRSWINPMSITPIRPITPLADEPATPNAQTSGGANRPDLRDLVEAEFRALMNREADRRNNEWRGTLELVRGALSALERTWSATGGKLDSPTPASAVSDLVEVIVAAARRDGDTAVRQARAEAQIETGRFADQVARLNYELQAERGPLKAIREAISTERDLRARAEKACRDAERDKANSAAQLAAQSEVAQAELETGRALVAQLRQQIEAEKNERAKLFEVVQTVQRALSSTDKAGSSETVPAGSPPAPSDDMESISLAARAPVPATPAPAKILRDPHTTAKEARATVPDNGQPASEKLFNPALIAMTERLFEEIERKYYLNVQPNLT